MIQLTVCLLFATAVLAQHYAPRGAPSSLPMDYNDDIYNRDMRAQPPSSFTYNFAQSRIDQPPHVENREENIGKYMGRPRPTTAAPVMPDLSKQEVPELETVHLHHLSDVKPTFKPYLGPQQWDPVSSHLPSKMPAAPAMPKWTDLSDDSFKRQSHYQPSRQRDDSYAPTPNYVPAAPPTYAYAEAEREPQPYEMTYAPNNLMPQYAVPSTPSPMPVERYSYDPAQQRQRSSSRGNHKFSWEDTLVPAQAAPNSTPAAAVVPAVPVPGRGPPPPVPTLSPWEDGFGK